MRFLIALVLARPWLCAGSVVCGALWLAPGALLPLLVGAAVDTGLAGADAAPGTLLGYAGAIVAVGVAQMVCGALLDHASDGMWIHGASALQRTVVGHTTGLGAALPEQAAGGEVAAVTSTDLDRVGDAFEVTGRLVGAVVAFGVVGTVLLLRSPLLGTVALVGVPLALAGIGPLLAPLQRRKDAQRAELVAVNASAADIVSGLRILRGVGGERRFLDRFRAVSTRVRGAGVEVARSEAWLSAAEVFLPGLVTIAITWLGARLALAGVLSVGELVAFYAASVFLVIPVAAVTEAASAYAGAVAAAKKACRLLDLRPTLAEPAHPVPLPPGPLELHDSTSGLTAPAGLLTVVDAGAAAEALAARLARFRDPAPGRRVLAGGVDLTRVSIAELRARVVHAHQQDVWFSGPLRAELTPAPRPGRTGLDPMTVLDAAAGTEIVDALPQGLDEPVGERGRELSGGQRQRLALARALGTDADVLVLDEPTSAVDAHTESSITERVARLRRGRTTVVFSRSALWRAVADLVLVPGDPRQEGQER